MAYYDALIAEWALLTPGTTTAKLTQLNAMTVTGTVPTVFNVTGVQILNCFVASEFNVLTPTVQQLLFALCTIPGALPAGTGTFVQTELLGIFTTITGPLTRANLAALAQAVVQPWWQANGYKAPLNTSDLIAAGNLT